MSLPDDVQPLFDRLGEFLFSDRLKTFRAGAARRCSSVAELMFGGDGDVVNEMAPPFLDYLAFSYREADGRSAVELFLKEEGPSLEPEERAAFLKFREAIFALFEVVEVLPAGLRLRLVGSDSRFEVKLRPGLRPAAPGEGLIGRLVPYRDYHILTGYPFPCNAEMVSKLEPILRASGGRARAAFADPVQFLESFRARLVGNRAPENLRQAQAVAASIFTATEFPFTIKEVMARFQRLQGPMEIFKECGLLRVKSQEQFRALVEAILALWNYTPLERLGGLTPNENHQRECRCGKTHETAGEIVFEELEGGYGRVRLAPLGPGKA